MLASTEGNSVRAFTLGSQGCLIDFLAQLFSLKVGVLLHPPVCFDNLVGIGSSRENLCHQSIRIQCDGRYKLLQLCRSLWRLLNRRLCRFGLVGLIGERSWSRGQQKAAGKKKGQSLF